MSYCTEQILLLAGSIYTGIGAPTAQSVGYVSGWITNSGGMLGEVNNRLGTSFYLSGAGPCIEDGFGPEEGAIATFAYQLSYYRGRALAVLANATSAVMWTELREGDTTIRRESPSSIAKVYSALGNDAEKALNGAVHDWKLNHTLSVAVNAEDLASYPSPS